MRYKTRKYFGTDAAPWNPRVDEQVEPLAPRQISGPNSTILLSLGDAPSEVVGTGRPSMQHNSSPMDAGGNLRNIPLRTAPSTADAGTGDYSEPPSRRSLNYYDPSHDPPIDYFRTSNPQAQSTHVSLTPGPPELSHSLRPVYRTTASITLNEPSETVASEFLSRSEPTNSSHQPMQRDLSNNAASLPIGSAAARYVNSSVQTEASDNRQSIGPRQTQHIRFNDHSTSEKPRANERNSLESQYRR